MPNIPATRAAAEAIHAAFREYTSRFTAITRRAKSRFENREWRQGQADALERLQLYRRVVDQTVEQLVPQLEANVRNAFVWREIKAVHARLSQGRQDSELGATFFNSITRRVFATVGVDPTIEYVDFVRDPAAERESTQAGVWTFQGNRPTAEIVTDLLSSLPFRPEYEDLSRDARLSASRIVEALAGHTVDRIEVLPPVFYRGQAAYVVGRVVARGELLPLLLAFIHGEEGIVTDAVLTDTNEISIVFSFTRSYFHVDVDVPHLAIGFLRSIMPRKPVDELYTAIGHNKHGKTVFYRNLMRHLETTEDTFVIAEGEPGLVMAVFALPLFNTVFKVIRDRFGAPKATTREMVRSRYDLVFVHDRVGRLADAQEYEHLEFDRRRFAPELLHELLRECASTVQVEGERVIIRHLYTERRVTPLNLFLREASPAAARDAMIDYGNAIRELAAANIFTGDMLLKNFGVTRHGRVIFYDYDELCLLTDCVFRAIPETEDPLLEMSAEPWYGVGERDVFPEEFRSFFVLPGELGDAFLSRHAELLTLEYWQTMQDRQARGEIVEFRPYREERRLARAEGSGSGG